jgi:hypothetical protein
LLTNESVSDLFSRRDVSTLTGRYLGQGHYSTRLALGVDPSVEGWSFRNPVRVPSQVGVWEGRGPDKLKRWTERRDRSALR